MEYAYGRCDNHLGKNDFDREFHDAAISGPSTSIVNAPDRMISILSLYTNIQIQKWSRHFPGIFRVIASIPDTILKRLMPTTSSVLNFREV